MNDTLALALYSGSALIPLSYLICTGFRGSRRRSMLIALGFHVLVTVLTLSDMAAQRRKYKSISDELAADADKLLTAIREKKTPFRGIVINVDYALSKLPRVSYYEWLDGLGAIISRP